MSFSIILQIYKHNAQFHQIYKKDCATPPGLSIWTNVVQTWTIAFRQHRPNHIAGTTLITSIHGFVRCCGGVWRNTSTLDIHYLPCDKVTSNWYYMEVYKGIVVVCISVEYVTSRPLKSKRRFAHPFLLGLFGFGPSLTRLLGCLLCSPQQHGRQQLGTFTTSLDLSYNVAPRRFRPTLVSTPRKIQMLIPRFKESYPMYMSWHVGAYLWGEPISRQVCSVRFNPPIK